MYTRYLNFYGQRGARLANDQTIYGAQPKRTPLIKSLSIFFFYAPELHLRGARGHHVLWLCAEDLSNRLGSRLYRFRSMSTQVGTVHYTAAERLDRIHPIRERYLVVVP